MRIKILCIILALCVCGAVYQYMPRETKLALIKSFSPETLRLRVTKFIPPAVWMFKEKPLFGWGLWSYRNMVYEAMAQVGQWDANYWKDHDNPKPRRVHNEYIEILAEGGIIAGLVLLVFVGRIMKHGWEVNAVAPLCAVSAITVNAFFFFPFRLNITLFLFVVMLGIIDSEN